MENIKDTEITIFSIMANYWRKYDGNSDYDLRQWKIEELAQWPDFSIDKKINKYFQKCAQECIQTGSLGKFLNSRYEVEHPGPAYNIWIDCDFYDDDE